MKTENDNKKFNHLTATEREMIKEGLDTGLTFTDIARSIHKDRRTVSREVYNHRIEHITNDSFRKKCKHLRECDVKGLCKNIRCDRLCKRCNKCTAICDMYELDICDRLLSPPYICNGCSIRSTCHKPVKYKYFASEAQKQYENILSSSREGINLSEEEFNRINELLSELMIEKDQHLYHIYKNHKDEIPVSIRTLYTYIEKEYFECRNIDLPRKVSYKPRKKHEGKKINKRKLRENRTYSDYLNYLDTHNGAHVIEMDTVEGIKGECLLLTLHSVREHLQIAHIIPNKESSNIRPVFEYYRERLNDDEIFSRFFEVILTDNGSEFSDILFLEEMGIHIFFCDPNRSDQKGACEKNHEYIRYYIEKGKSFSWMTMDDVWLMMSHINSVSRSDLNGKSPYEVTEYFWGRAIPDAFNLNQIKPDEVIMSNKLFKKVK